MPLLSLIFLLNPIAGIASWIWVALRNIDRTSWTALRGLALLLSLYLGFVNTTKELYGDFLAYNEYYRDALNSSLLQYLLLYAKEPIYYTFSWVICRLTDANWPIYVTFFTTASYMAIYEAVILIAKKTDCSKYHVITVLVFTAFFFQTFAMNGNMLRQSISQSFALLFLVYLYFNKRYKWVYAIISLGVHTASFPIIGLGVIPFIRRALTLKRLILLGTSIAIIALAFLSMSGILSKIMFIGYIFTRLDNTTQLTSTDSWQTEVGINAQFYILSVLLLGMIAYIYYMYHRSSKNHTIMPEGVIGTINITLIIILFVLLCNFTEAFYLCMRYQFYVYTFQSALLLLFLRYCSFRHIHLIEFMVCILMFPYFSYYFSNGVFKYASLSDIIINSPIFYIVKI